MNIYPFKHRWLTYTSPTRRHIFILWVFSGKMSPTFSYFSNAASVCDRNIHGGPLQWMFFLLLSIKIATYLEKEKKYLVCMQGQDFSALVRYYITFFFFFAAYCQISIIIIPLCAPDSWLLQAKAEAGTHPSVQAQLLRGGEHCNCSKTPASDLVKD